LQNFNALIGANDDALTGNEDEDSAIFGEVVIGLTAKLDMTLGVRVSSDDGRAITYIETDGFREPNLQLPPRGNVFGGIVDTVTEDADLGNITTNKFALTYQWTDDLMIYGSWGEGFTSGGLTNVNNVGIVLLNPEIVVTREVGLRSDWRDGTLRFNATYFDSTWDGMRVEQLPPDGQGGFLPFPYPTSDGLGNVDGFEFEVVYAPNERVRFNAGFGLVNTSYRASGAFDGQTGIAPDSPFAYAPDNSASVGVQYDLPLSNGNHMVFAGNYGWMDDYVRSAANQRTERNPDGTIYFEPAYGILNARVVLESESQNWNVALWGTNLTDERYINGGFDARFVWGYDFSLVGRSREVGVSLGFTF
jgi:iron complex outermembrane recepter protein